jgi:acyl-CoA synthetase (AMP-forming)/AMP-acid ligase II
VAVFASADLHPSNFALPDSGYVTLTTPVDDVTVAVLPMFHQYGILMYFTHALAIGNKLVVLAKYDVKLYLKLVAVHRVSAFLPRLFL